MPLPLFSNQVLVVDDDENVTQVLSALLKRFSLPARVAHGYGDAVRLLLEETFACALVDKNLPEKSGLDVIAEARRLQPYCGCILMTAFPSYESTLLALRSGAVDYLEKPFQDLPLVGEKVAKVIKAQWVVFERDTFAKQLRSMAGELKERDQRLLNQQGDLQLLINLIDYKVEERTAALRRKCQELEEQLNALRGEKTKDE